MAVKKPEDDTEEDTKPKEDIKPEIIERYVRVPPIRKVGVYKKAHMYISPSGHVVLALMNAALRVMNAALRVMNAALPAIFLCVVVLI